MPGGLCPIVTPQERFCERHVARKKFLKNWLDFGFRAAERRDMSIDLLEGIVVETVLGDNSSGSLPERERPLQVLRARLGSSIHCLFRTSTA